MNKSTMDEGVLNLGLVLKNIENFDMSSFAGRLTLQKTIYLMQAFGIYLGYDFSWYLRGPYSSPLAKNGFALQEIYEKIPTAGHFGEGIQKRFEQFLQFIQDKKNDPDRLEIIASIHFLKKIYPDMSKAEILDRVKKKQSYFKKEQCEKGWKELKEIGLI